MSGGAAGAERVEALLDLDRYAEARDLAGRLLAEAPDDAELHLLLGHARLALDDPAGALDAACSAVALDPEHPDAQVLVALSLLGVGRLEEAAAAAEEAVRLGPEELAGHLLLARLGAHVRPWQARAWEAAHHAVRLAPEEAETHYVVGHVAEARLEIELATRAYRHALSLDPEHAEAVLALARVDPLSPLRTHARGVADALRLSPQDPGFAAAADGWVDRAVRRAWLGSVAALAVAVLAGVGGLAAVVLLALWWRRLLRDVPTSIRRHVRRRAGRDPFVVVTLLVTAATSVGAVVATLGPGSWTPGSLVWPWLLVTGAGVLSWSTVRWWRRDD